jgi:hypothetical protein
VQMSPNWISYISNEMWNALHTSNNCHKFLQNLIIPQCFVKIWILKLPTSWTSLGCPTHIVQNIMFTSHTTCITKLWNLKKSFITNVIFLLKYCINRM